jgi:predicted nucleotidyltransferase
MTEDINKIIKHYLTAQPVRKAYLFGSYARAEENSESDIDILIELEENVDLFQFINIKLELEKLINKPVDLVSSNGISPRLKPYIDKDKILIYEKSNL